MIEILLKNLADDLEMEAIVQKNEQGDYPLAINAELLLSLKETDDGILIFSKIGACPQKDKEEVFLLVMKANFMGQGTGGATIGLDENENFLTLSLVLPYDMNYKMFKDQLENFTNYLDYWKEELRSFEGNKR